jgi:hypothetical protein
MQLCEKIGDICPDDLTKLTRDQFYVFILNFI